MFHVKHSEGVSKNMKDVLNIAILCLSAVLILLVLIQQGHSDGLSSAFTGSGDLNLFAVHKERGIERYLSRLTLFCGILFFSFVLLMQIL